MVRGMDMVFCTIRMACAIRENFAITKDTATASFVSTTSKSTEENGWPMSSQVREGSATQLS